MSSAIELFVSRWKLLGSGMVLFLTRGPPIAGRDCGLQLPRTCMPTLRHRMRHCFCSTYLLRLLNASAGIAIALLLQAYSK